jgi:quercetin dioxygenase-like cupin family protein
VESGFHPWRKDEIDYIVGGVNMICMNTRDVEPIQMKQVSYQGKQFEVKNTNMRWLTHKNLGGEEYQHNHAVRHVTVGPNGDIPMHTHKHTHVWYMLSGNILATSLNQDGEKEERKVGPGGFVYHYSFEPHALRNLSESESAIFICCIDCIDDKHNCVP